MRQGWLAIPAIIAAAALMAGTLAALTSASWIDWVFLTVLLSCLGGIVRQVVQGWRFAVHERRRAAELADTHPGPIALEAVREERRRLSADITRCLQEALEAIAVDARLAATESDPLPVVRRIRRHTQLATGELRRQLGLLRSDETDRETVAPAVASRSVGRRDAVVALLASAMAATESTLYPVIEGVDPRWTSTLLCVLAAGTVLTRSVSPGLAALACGTLYLVGLVLDSPIRSGFWFLITVAGLLWTIAARVRRSAAELAGGIFLILAVVLHVALLDHDNLGIGLVVMGVAVSGGFIVRLTRRAASASTKLREIREAELQQVADTAVNAEREMFARELHDVISHAIGLIAIQTSAAEVAWPTDPTAARKSVQIIQDTAETTLDELHRLVPGGPAPARTMSDLAALIGRIELAGTPVELTTEIDPAGVLAPDVYRIVQESLTNVVRHAPGASARVSVRAADDQVTVEVTDNGVASDAAAVRGYGLAGLAERVTLAGGALETGPASTGRGFRVTATVPLTVGLAV